MEFSRQRLRHPRRRVPLNSGSEVGCVGVRWDSHSSSPWRESEDIAPCSDPQSLHGAPLSALLACNQEKIICLLKVARWKGTQEFVFGLRPYLDSCGSSTAEVLAVLMVLVMRFHTKWAFGFCCFGELPNLNISFYGDSWRLGKQRRSGHLTTLGIFGNMSELPVIEVILPIVC